MIEKFYESLDEATQREVRVAAGILKDSGMQKAIEKICFDEVASYVDSFARDSVSASEMRAMAVRSVICRELVKELLDLAARE